MRVTDKGTFDLATHQIAKARQREAEATLRTSSGIAVEHPWDDPAAAAQIATHVIQEERLSAIVRGVVEAKDELLAADGALNGINEAVTQAHELAVKLSNDTYSANERTAAAAEVSGLYKEIIGLLNTQVGNRYIFGGALSNALPFSPGGVYSGDATVRQIEIAPGVLQDASVRADVALTGAGGGVNVLNAVAMLQTALTANDATAIRATLTELTEGVRQVALARGQAGASIDVFTTADLTARSARDGERTQRGHVEDANPFEAATELALARRALEATLTASAKSFSLTLLDKL